MSSKAVRRGDICLCVLVFVALVISVITDRFGAEINLGITLSSSDEQVTVTIRNQGRDPAPDVMFDLELAGQSYHVPVDPMLQPRESQAIRVQVKPLERPGSYPLVGTVSYLNDDQRLSIQQVAYFDYQTANRLRANLLFPDTWIRDKGKIEVEYDTSKSIRLVVPNEISILETIPTQVGKTFILKDRRPRFQANTNAFIVLEESIDGKPHGTQIASKKLQIKRVVKNTSVFSHWTYLVVMVFSFVFIWHLYCFKRGGQDEKLSATDIALLRWGFSVFLVSGFFLFFRTAYLIPEFVLGEDAFLRHDLNFKGPWLVLYLFGAMQELLTWFYFDGGNYDFFAQYVADPLYLYMLLGNYFVLRHYIKPDPATDKYWHLMRTVFSIIPGSGIRRIVWTRLTRLAILTLMVKLFYVPLLTSWTINNIQHQGNLIENFSWNVLTVNAFLVALFIFVDVAIFAFGYLTELPALKNQIKSVEPTILGWVVCLMCYPPFNQFSFKLFDHRLSSLFEFMGFEFRFAGIAGLEPLQVPAVIAITVLWFIYMWATLALGTRSSNLTNRGIVDRGPYRFIRHPAYASKVGLWCVEAVFLGKYFFFLVIAFIVIYALRAWTEERHLSADPDYIDYKQRVKYKIIPWVI